jgi:hypothetical protein
MAARLGLTHRFVTEGSSASTRTKTVPERTTRTGTAATTTDERIRAGRLRLGD